MIKTKTNNTNQGENKMGNKIYKIYSKKEGKTISVNKIEANDAGIAGWAVRLLIGKGPKAIGNKSYIMSVN
jgi:hypothetical protein